jgi:hypothetical protein
VADFDHWYYSILASQFHSLGMEAWRDFGNRSAQAWMDGFGISDDGGDGRCWRMSWMHNDDEWTIGGRLGSGPRGLKFGLIFFYFNKMIFSVS